MSCRHLLESTQKELQVSFSKAINTMIMFLCLEIKEMREIRAEAEEAPKQGKNVCSLFATSHKAFKPHKAW